MIRHYITCHLTPYIVIIIILTTFPMLYFTSPWLLGNYQFALLNPFTFPTHSPNHHPIWQPTKYSLYLWVCFCSASLFCFLDFTYKWNHLAFVFVCLIHSVQFSLHPPMLLQMARFHSLLGCYPPFYICPTSLSIHLLVDT